MADNGDVVINALAVSDAPADYEVPGSQHFVPLVVEAVIDGSGAAGTFIPAVVLLAPSGDVIGRGMARPVAAGSSAEVTFRPFLGDTPGEGVRFDTDPQAGAFLYVETTGTDPSTGGDGVDFIVGGGGDFNVETDGGTAQIQAGGGGAMQLIVGGGGGMTLSEDGGGISIRETGAGGMTLSEAGGGISITETNGGGIVISESGGAGIETFENGGGEIGFTSDGGFRLGISASGQMCVWNNHLQAPIFEIREDGSIHGRAAVGAITWDL